MNEFVAKGQEETFLKAMMGAQAGDAQSQAMVRGLVSNYFHGPERAMEMAVKARRQMQIKALAGTTDFPDLITNTASVFQETAEFDMGWMQAFDDVPAVDGKGFFEIATNTSTGSWLHTPEGGQVTVESFSGSKVLVPYPKYTYGLGWTLEMIQDKELGIMFDRARDARSKYFAKMRSVHMSLLVNSVIADSGTTVYDTVGSTTLDKDIATINKCHVDLGNSLLGLGLGDDLANAPVLLFASPQYRDRINRALRVTGSTLQSNLQVEVPVTPIYTWEPVIAGTSGIGAKFLMVLPGRKIKMSSKMEPTVFTQQNILTQTYVEALVARRGAAVAERKQVRFGKLS